jgi:coupling of ubiquitin conjugation to ER degradation protein 1
MTSSPSDPTTLNIPSLLAFAVISILAIRYLFFTPSSPGTTTNASSSGRRVPADRIEQVMVMFPQLQRRDVEWDLSRNGGSVASTTERVLREGRLPGVSLLL